MFVDVPVVLLFSGLLRQASRPDVRRVPASCTDYTLKASLQSELPPSVGPPRLILVRHPALAEGLCCPRCGEKATVERADARPTTWQDATYRVSCAAGDYGLVVSGRAIRALEGVVLKAA